MNLISFVGVDANTNFQLIDEIKMAPERLIALEFGVLHSESQKSNRYPGYNFCEKFLARSQQYLINTSLHLCGQEAISKYFDKDIEIMKLCSLAGRIQLNLNIKKFHDYESLSSNLLKMMREENHSIILQVNQAKESFTKFFLNNIPASLNEKLSLLYDASGGFGKELSIIEPVFENNFTGYAGGINSSNVKNIVKLIKEKNPNKKYYIDMESGIRTEDDWFSITKCQEIIDLVS